MCTYGKREHKRHRRHTRERSWKGGEEETPFGNSREGNERSARKHPMAPKVRETPRRKGNGALLTIRSKVRGRRRKDKEEDRGRGGGERERVFEGSARSSLKDGPCQAHTVVIQDGRVDERRRRVRPAERRRLEGEKGGGGCRGMRPWSRYIRAPVPAYVRVFVYLCGTPENPADERNREIGGGERGREQRERERARDRENGRGIFSREREGQRRRREPMASQGVLPFRYEGAGR